MTLDLDELERKAKAARPYRWNNYYPGQAPKELVDLRNAADSETVLALIERVRELEAKYVAPSQWRCDGCNCIARTEDGRRPDCHESCGGMWIRQERAT